MMNFLIQEILLYQSASPTLSGQQDFCSFCASLLSEKFIEPLLSQITIPLEFLKLTGLYLLKIVSTQNLYWSELGYLNILEVTFS